MKKILWTLLLMPLIVLTSYAQTVPQECLVIGPVTRANRAPLHADIIEKLLVTGQWYSTEADERIGIPNISSATANQEGWFRGRGLNGGYAYFEIQSDSEKVMLLDAQGHNVVYVNGELRTGDRYSTGITLVPIVLRAGTNEFLFQCGRGQLRFNLIPPSSEVMLNTRDNTIPDFRVGEPIDTFGAVVVLNTTPKTETDLSFLVSGEGLTPTLTAVPAILPTGIRKAAFRLQGPAPKTEGTVQASLQLVQSGTDGFRILAQATVNLSIQRTDQTYKKTFISDIDGSVQYYGVQPALRQIGDLTPPALFLTLHGASVEAIGQAGAYSPKTWGYLVAPTNRRPYGFDWEDWGRLDTLEVLDLAQKEFHTDPQRTYLTGHSMGGHGTWQVGGLFPERFAAIAPSAGWISFFSYGGGKQFDNPRPMEAMLNRAAAPCDTLSFKRNYLQEGVYILHGDADDNVPIDEARTMKEQLKTFHHDWDMHEQPGAGHWWDASPEPGTDCVDWAPIFDFFGRHRIPRDSEILSIDFTTPNPGVTSRSHWLSILSQIHPLQPSTVQIRFEPGLSRFVGSTTNTATLSLRLTHLPIVRSVTVELDGCTIPSISNTFSDGFLYVHKEGNHWKVTSKPDALTKGPHRYGPFKEAFQHHMIFVYGTQGSEEENRWALAKARYDAEEFWYRGNGSIDVIPDTEFSLEDTRDRGVILYGNAETNGAWKLLLADSPVQVTRKSVRVGDHEIEGENLACLFLQPRRDSEMASVGVITGTGMVGLRLCDRIPYFTSGVEYPDCIVMDETTLDAGSQGVHCAGFFGPDWRVKDGEFVWKE